MLVRFFIALTLIWIRAVGADAATITRADNAGAPGVFFLEGSIEEGDDKRFIEQVLNVETAVVVLNSGGGNLLAAIEIGKAIRLKGFGTLVPDPATCASSCGLIWLSGQPRWMGTSAKIGFHAAYDIANGAPRERGAANAIVGAYLGALGFSQRTILFLTSSPPEEMQWISISDATALGIDVQAFETNSEKSSNQSPAGRTAELTIRPSTESRSETIPKFRDFPSELSGPTAHAAVDLSTPGAHTFRTRLRQAAQQSPNFAGHYVLTSWGCGSTCVIGAAVDLVTGKVVFLPASICCWGAVDSAFEPVEFRRNSKLVVMSGQLNEEGPMGAHFFVFDGGAFTHIKTIQTSSDFGAAQR